MRGMKIMGVSKSMAGVWEGQRELPRLRSGDFSYWKGDFKAVFHSQ